MATLNLGRIKPVFRDAYAGGTAYVVDDIVTFGDETFICILASTGNATSNATYWKKLAAKGTDGTDVGTTITTQGDILFRDGSGLQRLAKGTAAQTLTMNAGATAPEWAAAASADYARQIKYVQQSTAISFNSTTLSDTGLSLTFDNNLKSTNSIVKITFNAVWGTNSNPDAIEGEYRYDASNKITDIIGNPTFHWGGSENTSSDYQQLVASTIFTTVSSTTPIAYRPFVRRQRNNGQQAYFGRDNDDSDSFPTLFMIEEYAE